MDDNLYLVRGVIIHLLDLNLTLIVGLNDRLFD